MHVSRRRTEWSGSCWCWRSVFIGRMPTCLSANKAQGDVFGGVFVGLRLEWKRDVRLLVWKPCRRSVRGRLCRVPCLHLLLFRTVEASVSIFAHFLTRPGGRCAVASTRSSKEDVADRGPFDRSPAPWDGLATRHATFGSRTSLPQQWSAAVADCDPIKIKSPDVQDEFFVQSGVILGATRRTG